MHIYLCMYTSICVYIYMYIYLHMCIYIYIHVCECVWLYIIVLLSLISVCLCACEWFQNHNKSSICNLLVNFFKWPGQDLKPTLCLAVAHTSHHHALPFCLQFFYLPKRNHRTKRLLEAKTSSENGFDASRVQFLTDPRKFWQTWNPAWCLASES